MWPFDYFKKRREEREKREKEEVEQRLRELKAAALRAKANDTRKVHYIDPMPPAPKIRSATVHSMPARQARREEESRRDDDLLNPLNLASPLNPIYHQPSYEPLARQESDDCHSRHHSSNDSHSSHSSSSSDSSSSYSCDSGSSSSSSSSSDW